MLRNVTVPNDVPARGLQIIWWGTVQVIDSNDVW